MLRLELLHLCDSLFPIGGFAYSDGLEAAAHLTSPPSSRRRSAEPFPSSLAKRASTDPPKPSATAGAPHAQGEGVGGTSPAIDTLEAWIDALLEDTFASAEGPVVWHAWLAFDESDWRAIEELDEEILALRPAAGVRRSSRAMGLRLLTTWQSLHPDRRLEHALRLTNENRLAPALPVAFAGACATSGIDRRESVEAFAYTRIAATTSAAMRLFAIGQTAAHALLARTLEQVPAVVDEIVRHDPLPRSFAPAMDIAAMTQPYLHSRLFQS
jgi:urease accessory protein UreF